MKINDFINQTVPPILKEIEDDIKISLFSFDGVSVYAYRSESGGIAAKFIMYLIHISNNDKHFSYGINILPRTIQISENYDNLDKNFIRSKVLEYAQDFKRLIRSNLAHEFSPEGGELGIAGKDINMII